MFLIIPRTIIIVPWTSHIFMMSIVDARLDAIVLIILIIWLYSLIKKWLPMRYPGEVLIVQNGVFYRHSFICWQSNKAVFDGAALEKRGTLTFLVIHYRLRKGTVGRTQMVELAIPVPLDMAVEAKTIASKLTRP
jgi:hypothetical protein